MRQFHQRMAIEESGDNAYLLRVDRGGVVSVRLARSIPEITLDMQAIDCECFLELRNLEADPNDWGLYRL